MHSSRDAASLDFFLAPAGAVRRRVGRLESVIAQRNLHFARTSVLLAARRQMWAARTFCFSVDLRAEISRTNNDPDVCNAISVVANAATSFSVVGAGRIAADRGLQDERDALVGKRALSHISLSPRLYVSPAAARATRVE